MDARPAHTGKIEMAALRIRRLEVSRHNLNLRLKRVHLRQPGIPILVKVSGTGVGALVGVEFLEGHIK